MLTLLPSTILGVRLANVLRAVTCVLIVVFAEVGSACSESTDPPLPVGFTITAPTTTLLLSPGGTAQLTFNVVRQNGFTGAVTVQMIPNHLNSVTAPTVTVPAGESTGTFTITADPLVPLGSEGFTLHATADGYRQYDLLLLYRITVPGTFTIGVSVETAGVLAVPGQVFHANVSILRDTYTQPITLSVDPEPGLTFVVTQPGTGNSGQITVTVGPNTIRTPGYTIRVTATGDGAPTQSGSDLFFVHAPEFNLIPLPATISVNQGTSSSVLVLASRQLGNTGSIVLSESTTATGVTFTPVTITGDSAVLQFSVAGNADPGTYPVTVTGTQGSLQLSASFTLIVVRSGVTLSVTTAPLNVTADGNPIADNISIVRTNFTGAVTVSATTDDSHLIATPIPATATTGSNVSLNVTTNPGTTAGTHTVTLTATGSGIPTYTTSFAVLVTTQGGYSLSAQTPSLNVTANAPAATSQVVTLNRNGFAGAVTVTATSDPSIIITGSPTTVTTGTTIPLTIKADNSAASGPHTVTLTGTAAGQVDVVTTFTVNVALTPGGAPTALVLVPTGTAPSPFHLGIGINQQFKAFLIDAAGNRTAPAVGTTITIQTNNSAVAGAFATSFDATQNWEITTVQGVGNGTTPLNAFYNSSVGAIIFSASTILAVP